MGCGCGNEHCTCGAHEGKEHMHDEEGCGCGHSHDTEGAHKSHKHGEQCECGHNHKEHAHGEEGCGCGCHAGHGHNHEAIEMTPEQELELLTNYKEQLKKEMELVDKEIAARKATK